MAAFGPQEVSKNDEITCYQMVRYISSNEAARRLLYLPRSMNVTQQSSTLLFILRMASTSTSIQKILNDSISKWRLLATLSSLPFSNWLCRSDPLAFTLLYNQVPQHYTWQQTAKKWETCHGTLLRNTLTLKKDAALGRVYTVHLNNFEGYFLWLLLHTFRCHTVKLFNGQVCETYR